jgi:hypothetical protein
MDYRQIDVLVAERVMGGFVADPDELVETGEVWYWVHPKDGVLRGEPYQYATRAIWDHQWHAWNPSTDIAAVWQVVEALNRNGWYVSVLTGPAGATPVVRLQAFDADGVTLISDDTRADTVPMAICLAALKAVGVEVENL